MKLLRTKLIVDCLRRSALVNVGVPKEVGRKELEQTPRESSLAGLAVEAARGDSPLIHHWLIPRLPVMEDPATNDNYSHKSASLTASKFFFFFLASPPNQPLSC